MQSMAADRRQSKCSGELGVRWRDHVTLPLAMLLLEGAAVFRPAAEYVRDFWDEACEHRLTDKPSHRRTFTLARAPRRASTARLQHDIQPSRH